MKVLHVAAALAPRYGGPSRACPELCRALVRHGAQVTIYSTNIDGDSDLDVPLDRSVADEGVAIRYFPVQPPRQYKCSLPLARALRDTIPDFDIVHVHSLYLFTSAVAAHYCRRFAVPYLVRPHGTLDPYIVRRHRGRKWVYERLVERRNLDHAAGLHFTTLEEAELARPFGFRAPAVVVPNGIDVRRFERLPSHGRFRARHPEIGNRKLVLHFGRINFKKGLDLVAEALGRLRTRDDWHLAVVGPDDEGYGTQVRTWLTRAGIARRATFTGLLLDPATLEALVDADVFVLPSYSENFGLAVVEAMACGLPVVISDRVNIWREVAAARAGLVIPCDAIVLADAIRTLLDDPERGRTMGVRGRRLVHERLTWDAAAAEMVRVYRSILALHDEPSSARA
ncbi:MAG TPA: glycosyltransferase [Candidatus Binatia bacterium]|nr:glycosyltransferase [Candidatus Binatia bacterium]